MVSFGNKYKLSSTKLEDISYNEEEEEEEEEENLYLDSVIEKLDEIENDEPEYLDIFYQDSLLEMLKHLQKESLENALILERFIKKEENKISIQEERENNEKKEVFYLIKVGLCLFWVYFLWFSIMTGCSV